MTECDHVAAPRDRLDEQFSPREPVSITRSDGPRYRLSVPDRTVVVSGRRGPDGTDVWTLTLQSDGEIGGKFVPLETAAAVLDGIHALADGAVRDTVCCGGWST